MARPNVPKFGNWESEDDTPYTAVFDNARKTRGGGKIINPNDPQENPDMFPNVAPPSKPKTRVSREDGDFRANSPARNGGRGSNSGRPARQSGGSDHGIAKSPLHPNSHYNQAKISGRVAASPVLEGKNSYDSSHGTPGRSFESARNTPGRSFESARNTPGRSFESAHATPGRYQTKQESPDRGAVVPKFGEWDDNDPQAAENYTEVFNKVREERHVDSGNPGAVGRASYSTQRNQRNEKQKSCCFPLW
ncbi:RPM1-interacting protein 4-like [Lycium ferocissimum]|uniref:RPM1-interacting protein 4-like n=1 Tax=Lycium ferocissimum TaxID=112874 RepID=UPI002815A2EB|nr:RPM1-interacting protein 4-like [Lycium ferocissimum]